MQKLIERLTREGPADAPFELRQGSVVTDPAKFHAALLLEIEGGPAGARAMMGSLEGDLRDFFARRFVSSIKKSDLHDFFSRGPVAASDGKVPE